MRVYIITLKPKWTRAVKFIKTNEYTNNTVVLINTTPKDS